MQTPIATPLGERLHGARCLVDLAARELDRLAQTTQGHTSLIESGVAKNITMKTAARLAGALGVTIDWLVNGTGDAPDAASVQAAVDVARARVADESGEHPAVDVVSSRVG